MLKSKIVFVLYNGKLKKTDSRREEVKAENVLLRISL